MSMELKKYKLGDVATIIVGYPFESERFNTEGKGILLVRGMNVSERFLRFGEEARWWDEITDKYLPYYLQENDVLIGMDGSKVGKNFAIVKKEDLPLLLVQRVACIRAKSGFDQHFIWQYVSSPRFIEYVNTIKTGSSIPHISGSQIANFPIFAPSFEIQTRIGSLLSNLDRKIALNRAINRNLEALAKQLYDYWFVQFDFPDENGRPYKSNGGKMVWNEVLKRDVPEGWKVKPLNEWLEIKSGFSFKSDSYLTSGKYKIITIKNVQENHLDTSGCDYLDSLPDGIKDWCKLKVDDRLISLTGNCGRLCIVTEKDLLLNQRVGLLYCDNSEKEYVYRLLCSTEFQTLCSNLAKGAAQANLSPIELCKQKSIYPPEKILSAFGRSMKPITEQYINNEQQNSNLVKQRDELLPLLMNGQVEVKQLNSDLSNS